jgi:hypothetical protein
MNKHKDWLTAGLKLLAYSGSLRVLSDRSSRLVHFTFPLPPAGEGWGERRIKVSSQSTVRLAGNQAARSARARTLAFRSRLEPGDAIKNVRR